MTTTQVREYTDKFTLDGRLRPQLGVSKAKVKAVQGLLEAALRGDIMADARLREAVTSSDAAINLGHLINLQFIPQLGQATYDASVIATTRVVPDFRPVVLASLFGNLTGPGVDVNGSPSVVPEGTPYPHVTVTGVESFYASLKKRGVAFDFTWEARVNDTIGFFDGLPSQLLTLTAKAEYNEVLDAIQSAGAGSALAGSTLPNGVTVPANSHITPDAIWEAILEMGARSVNGVKIGTLSGYNVLVPVGTKSIVDYALNQNVFTFTKGGNVTFTGDSYYQGVLANVTVVESPRYTGTQWALLPKPGATDRPAVDLLKLRGYETPELRVQALTGSYIGGGSISPFEGSFENDSIAYRYRYAVGGALWSDLYVVKSSGVG